MADLVCPRHPTTIRHPRYRHRGTPSCSEHRRRQTIRAASGQRVGEVSRNLPPFARFAVQRRAGGDIGGDIRDRDPDDMATLVLGVFVSMGIARVHHGSRAFRGAMLVKNFFQKNGGPKRSRRILAPFQGPRVRRIGLRHHIIRSRSGYRGWWIAIRDTALGRTGSPRRSTIRGRGDPHAGLWPRLSGLDQLAVFGTVGWRHGHPHSLSDPFIRWAQLRPPSRCLAENHPKHPLRGVRADATDQARPSLVKNPRPEPRSDAPRGCRSPAPRQGGGPRYLRSTIGSTPRLPFHRFGKTGRRPYRGAGICNTALRHRSDLDNCAALFQMAFGLQLFQHAFQSIPGRLP